MSGWQIHQLDGRLGEHALAWDALRARLFRANPMLDSRFVDAALKHFGDGSERLCILEGGGIPQAMAILRPAGAGRWATFLPSQMQIGPILLGVPGHVAGLIRRLPGFVQRIDFLCNDPDFGDLSLSDSRVRESRDHALTMNVSLADSFQAYWGSRSKNLTKNIGRYQRRLTDNGVATRFLRIDSPALLADGVARYAQLESSGWKGSLGTALDVNSTQGRFYREVTERFAQASGAAVYELWFNDRLAASRLTIADGDCIVILKTTYDESQAQYSPGRLLLHAVIQDLFPRHPGGLIEFYTDANADQLVWSTSHRWIRHVTFDRANSTSLLFDLIRASRQLLKPTAVTIAGDGEKGESDRVEIYRHPNEFPVAVQRLFETAETSSVDFGMTWYGNLVEAVYRDNPDALFYTAWVSGQPVAVLPVLISKRKWGREAQSLANFYSALYAPTLSSIAKPEDLVPLLHAIRDAKKPLASFRFAPMDPNSRSYRCLLTALRSAGMVPFHFFCFGNWYMKVDKPWGAYITTREGALRNTVKRMGKKFASDGGRLEVVLGGDALEEALLAYERVYEKSWKVREPFPQFMPGLVRASAGRGWLRLGLAWLHDQPVAAQVWIVANGKASIYKLAHDEAFKTYAPGTLLTALLMQHVIDKDKVTEVDYLIGDDAYKRTWLSDRRERWGLIAYNVRVKSGVLGLLWELIGRLASRLRHRDPPSGTT